MSLFLSSSPDPTLIFMLVCIAFLIFGLSARHKQKREYKNFLATTGASMRIQVPHTAGLPLPENVLCSIASFTEKYEITANGATFNLDKAKITDISIKTDTEIQKQYVSSVGGAIGGAVLLGPLGAIIGGRAKSKKSKTTNHYLIITYNKNESLEYIGFKVVNSSVSLVKKFINEFNASGKKNTYIKDL